MHNITVKDFPHLDFGDKRRDRRFVTLIDNLTQHIGSSIPGQNDNWYETKATYNFFKNEEITIDSLKKTIASYGAAQVSDLSQVLIIHDISNISFSGLQAEGLGYLDHGHGRGILSFNSIAASIDGLPIALMYQNTWTRSVDQMGKAKDRKGKNFEDKESNQWYLGITEVNKSIGNSLQKIHIADRQADIYELFFSAYEEQTDLLIRAHVNRKLSNGSHLWTNIASQDIKGHVNLQIPDQTGKKKQEITASVRYEQVEILRPSTSKDKYESVELTAIEVVQTGMVDNEDERIEWRLLTTLDVRSLSDVLKYIKWYTYRWLIERFHYVLKSGTKIENLQLKQAKSLQKAISVYSLAAFRVMQLVYQSRHYSEVSCEVILTRNQWQTLYMLFNKSHPVLEQPPNLQQAVRWIGKLGGHLGRKSDGPPGLKTVWLGYQKLCHAVAIYELTVLGKD
ncbi:MAG: IS4 family transposase [Flavipsychrobacter sp.]|nr:IS4 family transposase [Flavipsychrobacter sp.]